MVIPRWHVRATTVDDVPALISLVQDYWQFEAIPGFEKARVEPALRLQLADAKMAGAWVALADSVPIGYLLAVYVFSLEHLGLTAEIDEFYVLPEHRHSGVGTALLKSAEATFAVAGCTNVSLQLGRGNDAARAFYRRHGYRERDGYDLLDKSVPGDPAARLRAGVASMQLRLEGLLPSRDELHERR